MIFLSGRSSERGHDGVADELLDGTAGLLDLGGHGVVETIEQSPGTLRVR